MDLEKTPKWVVEYELSMLKACRENHIPAIIDLNHFLRARKDRYEFAKVRAGQNIFEILKEYIVYLEACQSYEKNK